MRTRTKHNSALHADSAISSCKSYNNNAIIQTKPFSGRNKEWEVDQEQVKNAQEIAYQLWSIKNKKVEEIFIE